MRASGVVGSGGRGRTPIAVFCICLATVAVVLLGSSRSTLSRTGEPAQLVTLPPQQAAAWAAADGFAGDTAAAARLVAAKIEDATGTQADDSTGGSVTGSGSNGGSPGDDSSAGSMAGSHLRVQGQPASLARFLNLAKLQWPANLQNEAASSNGRRVSTAAVARSRQPAGVRPLAQLSDAEETADTAATASGTSTDGLNGSPAAQCDCVAPEPQPEEVPSRQYGHNYLAICLAVKGQHRDMREWVAHHQAVGAGKLYVYDTGSEPPLNETLQDHIDSGLVEHIWWPPDFGSGKGAGRRFPQEDIYRDCLSRFRHRHQFIAFIDSDEFIILKNGPASVPALLQHLQAFEPIGGLVMNWVVFGSSGHVARPDQGVLQSYTHCMPLGSVHSSHVKTIANTDFVDHTKGPHHFNYTSGRYAVNERFQRVDGPTTKRDASVDKIALHHYVLKSEEEYREKMERGSAMGNHKPFSFFTAVNNETTEHCTDGLRWGPYT